MLQDREAQQQYVDSAGLRNGSDATLVPIQTAVFKLAKAGEALERDDAQGAASTLGDAWVSDFVTAGSGVAKTTESKSKLEQISSAINGARDAAGTGNVAAAKVAYVGAVEAIEDWVQSTGLASSLKGL
jgi:hypothetical protein